MTLFEYAAKNRRFIEAISIDTPKNSEDSVFVVRMLARRCLGGPIEKARIEVWSPKTLHWSFVEGREEEIVKALDNWFANGKNVDPPKKPLVAKVRKIGSYHLLPKTYKGVKIIRKKEE